MELVSRILGRAPLYRYADPLGAMNLAVMHEGDALGWHFDQTDFVVSLAIQPSDAGGEFENVQRLRWTDGGGIDERYDTVARVLAGDAPELVTTVPDDARHAHALRGPLVAAPRHRRSPATRRGTSRCSATTPSPAR